jgi:hypothetical protein
MNWKTGRSPYLRSASKDGDDLFIVANSFEPRCLHAISTARSGSYAARRAIIINYESSNPSHAILKSRHGQQLSRLLAQLVGGSENITLIETRKYDVIAFADDVGRCIRQFDDVHNVLIDISTFTKCTLATLLTLLLREFPDLALRCVWTPGVYGDSLEITHGVKDTFVVPGFGGVGWKECRVLVLFLGQELDRAYALWRAVDPDLVYLIASESEYSTVTADTVLKSARFISALVDTREFIIDGIDPSHAEVVLDWVRRDLRDRKYLDEVAVACLGTKLEMLGVWAFFHQIAETDSSWHYVYAAPRSFAGNKYTREFVRELNEIDIIAGYGDELPLALADGFPAGV